MAIELDKGHEEPIFGPAGKPNMVERFRLAREIVREYSTLAKRLVASAPVRLTVGRMGRHGRRGRLA